MITITRRQARRLRLVFRRSLLGIAHRGPIPPLVLRAEGTQLRVQHRYAALAVECTESGTYPTRETMTLPLDALAQFEGREESSVFLEAVSPDRTVVRWVDRGVPRSREFPVPSPETGAHFPVLPTSWEEGPPELLDALAEANATTTEDSTRYALNCLQLRGEGGIAATDGRQLLVRGGFHFPWHEDLLVRRSAVLSCPALSRDRPFQLGKTGTHVVLRIGPWTLCFEIQTEGRFPSLTDLIPDPSVATTRLTLDPDDAHFLGEALERLPGVDEVNSPATLDLNGKIAVRASATELPQATELILSRSAYTGPPVRLCTDRAFLGRAVRLGFGEIEIRDECSPLVCRDAHRRYLWQPLAKESAIEPAGEMIRIESGLTGSRSSDRKVATPKARPTVSTDREEPPESTERVATVVCSPAEAEPGSQGGLASLIQDAESLQAALADARGRAGRLIVALRRHRRRERLVNATLASLKALKLQDVAD